MKDRYLALAKQKATIYRRCKIKNVDDAIVYIGCDAVLSYVKYLYIMINKSGKLHKTQRLVDMWNEVSDYVNIGFDEDQLSTIEGILCNQSVVLSKYMKTVVEETLKVLEKNMEE